MIDDKYSSAGVDYGALDQCKRVAQAAALGTASALAREGFEEIVASRGESAYVVDVGPLYVAQVTEALGSKNLVADAVRVPDGPTYYDAIAKDAVATIVNDLATVGATPVSLTSYWAVGDAAFFSDERRLRDLTEGWAAACHENGIAWGGGETQVLKGIVEPGAIVLGGSAVGVLASDAFLHGDRIRPGDAILIAPSTGIHANGLTLARQLADRLPAGYRATVSPDSSMTPGGTTYGEALLVPTPQYLPLVHGLLRARVPLHYATQITGHGWRKFMRAARDLVYTFERVPKVPPVLKFIQEQAGMSNAEAYGTFNMGAGIGLYLPGDAAEGAIRAAQDLGFALERVGRISEGPRAVRIDPIGVSFEGSSLRLRLEPSTP
jgi:phosphoribosylformylglycinamidine cyclo-ligase